MKPIPGRRAIWLSRISAVMHALEPLLFGVGLAAGIFLTTRQAGEIVLLGRRHATSAELMRGGGLLVLGITLVAASMLFFHRKGRLVRQRLIAAAAAVAFFAIGYRGGLGSGQRGSFFGVKTLAPRSSFVEDQAPLPEVKYEINRWGLRGADWAEAKPEGVVRVAVAGGASVFGSGVEEGSTLPRRLEEALRERFPRARFEALNLGTPGHHLRSHLAVLRIAEEALGADVLVLCLTLPDGLSAWDSHEEGLERERVGSFSFTSFLLGDRTAAALWTDREGVRELSSEALRFLEDEAARFASARRPDTARPLVVLSHGARHPRVAEALRRIPRAVVLTADGAPQGSPTAREIQDFSRQIAAAFDPSWAR